jgi:hypothetical protein
MIPLCIPVNNALKYQHRQLVTSLFTQGLKPLIAESFAAGLKNVRENCVAPMGLV